MLTPILKSGGYRVQHFHQVESRDGTITLSAGSDFIGYENAYYEVEGRKDGGVRIRFQRAEVVKNGVTTPQAQPRVSLFHLPHNARLIRLIYLVRVSEADHNMAVVAARDRETLQALTQDVMDHPATGCRNERGGSCAWVPGGIAVRVEEAGKR